MIVVGAVVALAAVTALLWYLLKPRYDLKSAYVTEEPRLDGKATETVWTKAEPLTIPVKDGPTVTLKTVYTGDKVFFQAQFKDDTKDDIDEPWMFDGKTWKRGRTSDQFALFFDIDQSIKDFETKGFGVMTYGFVPGAKLWHFGITGPKNQSTGKYWDGYNQRADVWMMHSSISSPFDKGDDGYFAVNRQYLFSPSTTEPRIWTQWDDFSTSGVLKLNTNLWQEAIRASDSGYANPVPVERPIYTYKPGLDIKNTPYPYTDQMVEITDYNTFKSGDRLPWVYFDRVAKGNWGGSRADIDGKMRWENNTWTVEMGRKLNTGNADDIAFKPADDVVVYFGVLVRTNGLTIRYSIPARLHFAPKGGG